MSDEVAPGSDPQETPEVTAIPPFNPHTRYLGTLCLCGHDYAGTGQSLRNIKGRYCIACNREGQKAKRQGWAWWVS